jgi:hypothetical protein
MFWRRIRIRFGSGFNRSVDPDPDSEKKLDPDPDSINPDPQHWFQVVSSHIEDIQYINSLQFYKILFFFSTFLTPGSRFRIRIR